MKLYLTWCNFETDDEIGNEELNITVDTLMQVIPDEDYRDRDDILIVVDAKDRKRLLEITNIEHDIDLNKYFYYIES